MQIKAADDRQPQIDALTALLARADLDTATKSRIETEIRQVRAGIAGEREAAYEIEFHLGPKSDWVTIHDLRLEVDGRVAQIDHLIIDRLVTIWVRESKHFREGVAVDDFGNWVGFFNSRPHGTGSPIVDADRPAEVVAVEGDVVGLGDEGEGEHGARQDGEEDRHPVQRIGVGERASREQAPAARSRGSAAAWRHRRLSRRRPESRRTDEADGSLRRKPSTLARRRVTEPSFQVGCWTRRGGTRPWF